MIDLLNNFQNDEHTREAVKAFFFQEMDKYALEMVYNMEDTLAIAEAKKVIERAFVQLGETYSRKKVKEIINKAR